MTSTTHTEDWKMAVHVADHNVRLGIAPSTESLLHRWRDRRAAYPEACRPADLGSVSEDKARQWARRWRLRWGARHGAIRVRDELPVGEARSKAGPDTWVLKKSIQRVKKTRPKWARIASQSRPPWPGLFHRKIVGGSQCEPILVSQCETVLVSQNLPFGKGLGWTWGRFFGFDSVRIWVRFFVQRFRGVSVLSARLSRAGGGSTIR